MEIGEIAIEMVREHGRKLLGVSEWIVKLEFKTIC